MRSTTNRLVFALYLLMLGWAPIPLGSNRIWAWSLLEAVIYALVAMIIIVSLIADKAMVPTRALSRHRTIIALFAFRLLYLLFQCLPLPVELIAVFSSAKAGWYQTGSLIPDPSYGTLTASVSNSLVEFYKQLAYVLFFCLTLCLVDTRKRFFLVIFVLVAVASMESVYSVIAQSVDDIFMRWRPIHSKFTSGTFVNKNHFAANLSFATALTMGLCLYCMPQSDRLADSNLKSENIRRKLLSINSFLLSPAVGLLGVLLILITGLVLSLSRGAIVALTASVVVMIFYGVHRRGRRSPEGRIFLLLLFISVLASYWIGNAKILASFMRLASDTSRLIHWRQTLDMFSDFWLTGVGNGAYQHVFTQFKDGKYVNYLIDFAHNDHLQLLAEQGLLGAILWFTAIGMCCIKFLSAYRMRRRNKQYQQLSLGIITACLAFFLHGFIDFNFHIPANALWFYTLLGLGLVVSTRIKARVWTTMGV